MKRLIPFALLLPLLLGACARSSLSTPTPQPVFHVTVADHSDEAQIKQGDNETVITIQSPNGIGSANIELGSGTMPETMIVRLHLTGLEEFRLISKQTTISASFSSAGVLTGNNQKSISAGEESPITPIHPYWLDIRIVSDQETPDIPLIQGYFEVELPKEFLQETGNSFEIQWVDFYR